MRRVLAALLVIEALWTVTRLASLVSTIEAYDWTAILLIAARGLTGAMLMSGGWLLFERRQSAAPIAGAALLLSAVLFILDAGLGLAPSGIYPFWRWQFVGAYWLYAIAANVYLRFRMRS